MARRNSRARRSVKGVFRNPSRIPFRRKRRLLPGSPLRDYSASDTLTISISESSALTRYIPKAASDTLTISISETGSIATPIDKGPGADTITVGLSEALVVSKPIGKGPVADSVTVSITDSGSKLTLSHAWSLSDTISVSVTEGEVVRRDKFGADSILISIDDTADRRSLAPTTGTWIISPPLVVPAGPVNSSQILWEQETPGRSTALVETSIDNGASWQVATTGQPIPLLAVGSTSVRAVLVKVTLTRADSNDLSPRVDRLEVAVDVDSTTEELVPLGVFTIDETTITDGSNGSDNTLEIEISGSDLSKSISLNQWDGIKTIPAGTNAGDAIKQVISDRRPGTVFNFASTAETFEALTFGAQGQNDPWQDVLDLAETVGMEVFFDARGICTMRPEPDPEVGAPVWYFSDSANPTVCAVSRRITAEDTFNYVIVTSENASGDTPPFRGVAYDDDPSSPTYYKGPFGTRVFNLTTNLVTSNAQAQAMAAAVLARHKGATEIVETDVVPNAALEHGDIVNIDRSRSKIDTNFLIDSGSIPLGPSSDSSPMHLVTRRTKLAGGRPLGGGVGGLPGSDNGSPGGSGSGGGGGTVLRTYTTPGECHKIGTNGALNHFKLQTAFTGGSGIVEKSQSQIGAGYAVTPEYCMTTDKTAVQMQVNLNAPTTSGSSNPRTEYREMDSDGTGTNGWNPSSGTHWAQSTFRAMHLPASNQSCSFMQIHDTSDDVLQVITSKVSGVLKLGYRVNGGSFVSLFNYTVGDWYTIRIEYSGSTGKIYGMAGTDANNVPTTPLATFSPSHSGNCYFKIGTYPQQTTSESSSDHATAEFKKLGVMHPGYPTPVFDDDYLSTGAVASFKMAFGACINAAGSDAFTRIKDLNPDWFVHLGDVWYRDGATPSWNTDWNTKFNESRYAAMLANLPNEQIVGWSDHDFGYNNNTTGSDDPTRTANANAAYRTQFPNVTLPANGIYRTWVIGRVRFILLDMLTFKSPLSVTDNSSKTMLGATQKAWYKNLLATSTEPLIVVFGDGQIPGPAEAGQDEWRGYDTERRELANNVSACNSPVIYANGDTHCLAYGHDQYGYARCWQAAPFHNATKVKAGGDGYLATYPTNANEGSTQELYAVITFADNGDTITVTYRGYEGTTVQLADTLTVSAPS